MSEANTKVLSFAFLTFNLSEANMCLTIPKKVISISDNNEAVVENPNGNRQTVKTIVELEIGDWVLTQQNVAVQILDKKEAEEVFHFLREGI